MTAANLRLPVMREQFFDPAIQVLWQPLDHAPKIRSQIVAMHLCPLHQAQHNGGVLAGKFAARE